MKKVIYFLIVTFVGLLTFNACDVLDKQALDEISGDAVWKDPNLIEAYVNDIYLGMGHGLHEIMLASMTSDAHFIHNYGTADVVQATINSSDRGAYADWRFDEFDWENLYSRIRQTNIFFKRIDASAFTDETFLNRLKGEVYFLRAYFYHNLLRMYGGVPIITKVYGLNDEDMLIERNSFKETVEFIVQQADSAASLLPVEYSGDAVGRASKGAALALKSRVLLYAASDLYHKNPSGMAVTGYTQAQDRQALWQAAKDAAKEVMDLGAYHLFRANPAPGDSTAANYYQLFLTPNNEEVIMSRFFIKERDDGYNPGLHNGPNGYHNWGGNTPTQNLVDAYQMADGSEFSWDNPKQAAHPYQNRDPRFYATILYDGADWRERPADVAGIDPDGIIQTFTQITAPDGSTAPGIDTRDGSVENWNGSYTGYYLRKFIDQDVKHSTSVKQEVPWIFFRYAEILLNYAEASIELGDENDARRALNKIRQRAGMPEYEASVSGQELMEQLRYERHIELAFEEHWFFDVRRWMVAEKYFDEPVRGIDIYVKGIRSDRSTYHDYRYEVKESVQRREWKDKMYFAPIPYEEMNRNKKLVQNPNYN